MQGPSHTARRRATLFGLLAALALPAAASARKPSLSVARAKQAVAHAEPWAAVTACHRVRALQVDCWISEDITEGPWAGWNHSLTVYAILHRNGQIAVSTVYSER